MAISDYKIQATDINPVKIVGRATVLNGTVTQNQQAFDDYSDMIVGKFNSLIDFLSLNIEQTIDNDTLALYISLGWTAPN